VHWLLRERSEYGVWEEWAVASESLPGQQDGFLGSADLGCWKVGRVLVTDLDGSGILWRMLLLSSRLTVI